jgi:hypothetical protein
MGVEMGSNEDGDRAMMATYTGGQLPAAPPYHCHEPLLMGWKGVLQSGERHDRNMEDEDSHKRRGKGNDGMDNKDMWGTKTLRDLPFTPSTLVYSALNPHCLSWRKSLN